MKSINDNDFDLIEYFLSGKLKPNDEKEFKERLEKDARFSKEYNFRVEIEKYWIEADMYQNTKMHLKSFFHKEQKNRRILYSMLAAASIIILFGASVLFFPQLKYKNFIPSLIRSEKDTITDSLRPLQIDKLIEKGNLYKTNPIYHSNDTLYIQRKDDFPEQGEVCIIRIEDKKQIFKMDIIVGMDSIFIPLQGIKSGEYQWVIMETAFSGIFTIEDNIGI